MGLYDEERALEQEIEEWWNEGGRNERDAWASVSEMVDSSVPIYTSDLLQLALDNFELATATPESGIEFETPLDGIRLNIYDYFNQIAGAKLQALEEEDEEAEDCEQCGEKIFDMEKAVDVSDDGQFSIYVHADCAEQYEIDNPVEVPESIGECEECGNDLFTDDDIIIEEGEEGEELYYHPACSPAEKVIVANAKGFDNA